MTGLRYLTYCALFVLGACAFHGEQTRSNWDTIFADSASCGGRCGGADDAINTIGKGKR